MTLPTDSPSDQWPLKAYKNLEFLNSPEARAIRILCEYEEPKSRFIDQNVEDTVVFFGSARAKPLDVTKATIAGLEADLAGRSWDNQQ